MVTGTPVRGDFFKYTREEARAKLGFPDDRPLLLSYWGSLGAEPRSTTLDRALVVRPGTALERSQITVERCSI